VFPSWHPRPRRQLGIVEFGPLKPYFLELHGGAVAALPTLPGELPLTAHLDRGWSSDGGSAPPTQPALVRRPDCRCHFAVSCQRSFGAACWAVSYLVQAPPGKTVAILCACRWSRSSSLASACQPPCTVATLLTIGMTAA